MFLLFPGGVFPVRVKDNSHFCTTEKNEQIWPTWVAIIFFKFFIFGVSSNLIVAKNRNYECLVIVLLSLSDLDAV